MFGSLHNDFIKSLIWIQEYSTDASRQRENTESVSYCSRPAKRVLFCTSRCSPVFSSFHQQKIKCCWNPGPFQKKPVIITCRPCASRAAHEVHYRLAFTHLPVHISWGERWRGRRERTEGMKEMERENNESKKRRWEVYMCMLGGTKHIGLNEIFVGSNDWYRADRQPGVVSKILNFSV